VRLVAGRDRTGGFELRVEEARSGAGDGALSAAEVIGRPASAASRRPVGSLGLFLALSVEADAL